MNWLITLAIILVAIWILAEVLGWALGALVHLLWIIALVLLVIWLYQKVRGRR
ncbi:MAG: hypothetical protein ACOCVZ_00625 [Gemmatimonadota bacterium]